jgi:hypothetical protein
VSAIEPPPDHYIRHCARVALQGVSVVRPLEPENEPSNVHSIDAARTRRATREMIRRRGEL